jgi:hypothetical protein
MAHSPHRQRVESGAAYSRSPKGTTLSWSYSTSPSARRSPHASASRRKPPKSAPVLDHDVDLVPLLAAEVRELEAPTGRARQLEEFGEGGGLEQRPERSAVGPRPVGREAAQRGGQETAGPAVGVDALLDGQE